MFQAVSAIRSFFKVEHSPEHQIAKSRAGRTALYPAPGAASNRLSVLVRAFRARNWHVLVVTRQLPSMAVGRSTMKKSALTAKASSASTRRPRDGAWARSHGCLRDIRHPGFLTIRRITPAPDVIVADPPPTTGLVAVLLARRLGMRSVYYLADSWNDLVPSPSHPQERCSPKPWGRSSTGFGGGLIWSSPSPRS